MAARKTRSAPAFTAKDMFTGGVTGRRDAPNPLKSMAYTETPGCGVDGARRRSPHGVVAHVVCLPEQHGPRVHRRRRAHRPGPLVEGWPSHPGRWQDVAR